MGTTYSQPHFFILNKGNNSGKPMPEYCANCFVFLADDLSDKEFHYFFFQGLWQLKLFLPHLTGSVIPFIRIGDLTDLVEEALHSVNSGERRFEDVQDALFQIEFAKDRLQQQLSKLMQLRKSIFYSFIKTK
ncbi:MAG: hypothetical protein ABIP51_00470 [Bacteroidia bacterium]